MIRAVYRHSKQATWVLLVGSLTAHVFVAACVLGTPVVPDCSMEMNEEAPGPGMIPSSDCCMSCIDSLAFETPASFGAAIVAVFPNSTVDTLPVASETSQFPLSVVPSPTGSAPFFILNSTLLI